MPLHAETECEVAMLDGFDDAIGGQRARAKLLAKPIGRVSMRPSRHPMRKHSAKCRSASLPPMHAIPAGIVTDTP